MRCECLRLSIRMIPPRNTTCIIPAEGIRLPPLASELHEALEFRRCRILYIEAIRKNHQDPDPHEPEACLWVRIYEGRATRSRDSEYPKFLKALNLTCVLAFWRYAHLAVPVEPGTRPSASFLLRGRDAMRMTCTCNADMLDRARRSEIFVSL